MAICYCPSSLRYTAKDHVISLPRVNFRDNSEKRNCLIYASSTKSEKDLFSESKVELLLDSVKWDQKGLVVAIAQNVDTGAVLMEGYANREALATTRIAYQIIYLGKPDGPTCHTGSETCYYTSVFDFLKASPDLKDRLLLTTLSSLESIISTHKAEIEAAENGKPSWTKRLLCDYELPSSKIREEADELCRTLEENEDKSRAASEMADLIYHGVVLLAAKGVRVEEILEVLRHRFSQSGIEEKSGRKSNH